MDSYPVAMGRELSPMASEFGSPLDETATRKNMSVTAGTGLSAATPAAEEEKTQIINFHGNEKIMEHGGPNGRYAKLNVILGKGAYKIVWKALDMEEGIEVAWNSCQTTKNEFVELTQEIEILKRVRHPNIITFLDSWYTNGELVFITEMMTSGTLRDYVGKLKSPSLRVIRRWGKQLLKGLFYLHSHAPPIIHRDIKCDNIFVNGSHGELKIGDMGTAKMRFGKKYTVIGTPEFMAPEMYEEKGYSEKVDIYAFGMCLLEMVTGQYPYAECKNAAQIYKKVSASVKPECLALVEDKEILAIINGCISFEEEHRYTAKRLLEHPMFADDPEVVLLSADEKRSRLILQVMFKSQDKPTIKFDFNTEADTAEDVVREMIQEQILSSRYQVLVSNEIHRIIKDINRLALEVPRTERPISPQHNLDDSKPVDLLSSPASSADRRASESLKSSDANFDLDPPLREYPNDFSIEEFISDIAVMTKRPLDKANEWLGRLQDQDIMTVGDLRHLHDEDWSQLSLTVFACRAIRNALSTKPKNGLAGLQSNATIKVNSPIKSPSLLEDSAEALASSPVMAPNSAVDNTPLIS